MTESQHEALVSGGLSEHCLDAHPWMVCVHCGACRGCQSGCGCDDAEDCACPGCQRHDDDDGGE